MGAGGATISRARIITQFKNGQGAGEAYSNVVIISIAEPLLLPEKIYTEEIQYKIHTADLHTSTHMIKDTIIRTTGTKSRIRKVRDSLSDALRKQENGVGSFGFKTLKIN